MARQAVRDFYGRILGFIDDGMYSNKVAAQLFTGEIVGFYDESRDVTMDFYGRIICTGNGLVGLIESKAQ